MKATHRPQLPCLGIAWLPWLLVIQLFYTCICKGIIFQSLIICIKYYCDNNEMKSCYNYNGFIPGCFAILVVGTMQTFPQVTSNVNPGRRGVLSGASIPMITELGQFMNISSFSG